MKAPNWDNICDALKSGDDSVEELVRLLRMDMEELRILCNLLDERDMIKLAFAESLSDLPRESVVAALFLVPAMLSAVADILLVLSSSLPKAPTASFVAGSLSSLSDTLAYVSSSASASITYYVTHLLPREEQSAVVSEVDEMRKRLSCLVGG